ncbi:MAG: hypothetical protein Q8P81_00470 [Nanoarchaeota archaeon]|nr:hypothetical protein [Nanoarchaeota archaeon]
MDQSSFLIGAFVLLLGLPIGNYLAGLTKEELKSGQIWFRRLIVLALAGAIISLFIGNDALLFSFLFIAIVTSRSLRGKK